jgi:hypothetical protein
MDKTALANDFQSLSEYEMKTLFFSVALVSIVTVATFGISRVEADPSMGVPQQLIQIQNSLNTLSEEVSEIQKHLDAGIKVQRTKFYITKGTYTPAQNLYTGSEAPSACVQGFHMANLFEILDPSNLEYDTTLGWTREDSGSGPPSYIRAWVRTGQDADAGESSITGYANCNAYTSSDPNDWGVIVGLSRSWRYDPNQPADQHRNYVADWWVPLSVRCDQQAPVWCVQDP